MFRVYVPMSSKCHNLYAIQITGSWVSSVTNSDGKGGKAHLEGGKSWCHKELKLLFGYLDENPSRFWSQDIHENKLQSETKVKYKNSNHEEIEDNVCE